MVCQVDSLKVVGRVPMVFAVLSIQYVVHGRCSEITPWITQSLLYEKIKNQTLGHITRIQFSVTGSSGILKS
jgi:hypothetical protein